MLKDLCFEIIEKCPNECKFCSSNSCINRNKIIKLEDFKRVIDYFISTSDIEELSLSGGEPFLHKDLYEMVKYSKNNNIKTVIFTSGVKYRLPLSNEEIDYYEKKMNEDINEVKNNEPWNDRLINNIKNYYERTINPSTYSCITKNELKILKDIGLNKIVFDYQAYELETDNYLMGRDSIKRECLLNSLINASLVGIDVDIHFVPMKPNYKEINDILEMLEIANIKNISILNFVPQGRGNINKDDLLLNKEELQEFMKILNESKNIYSGNIRIGIPLQNELTHKCNAGLEKLDIKYDGTILPCPAFKELDLDTMKKYSIKLYNIYDNLDDVKIYGGKRLEPLCKKIYK